MSVKSFRSWLDHIVVSPCLFSVIEECNILYDSVASDHFPLLVRSRVNGLPDLKRVRQGNRENIKWNFSDLRKREEYGRMVTDLLRDIDPQSPLLQHQESKRVYLDNPT